jgi:hypothetical protein
MARAGVWVLQITSSGTTQPPDKDVIVEIPRSAGFVIAASDAKSDGSPFVATQTVSRMDCRVRSLLDA